jgi:hypothetical protein
VWHEASAQADDVYNWRWAWFDTHLIAKLRNMTFE